jgi:hypothetical protein
MVVSRKCSPRVDNLSPTNSWYARGRGGGRILVFFCLAGMKGEILARWSPLRCTAVLWIEVLEANSSKLHQVANCLPHSDAMDDATSCLFPIFIHMVCSSGRNRLGLTAWGRGGVFVSRRYNPLVVLPPCCGQICCTPRLPIPSRSFPASIPSFPHSLSDPEPEAEPDRVKKPSKHDIG